MKQAAQSTPSERRRRKTRGGDEGTAGMNVVALGGRLSGPAAERVLSSGTRLMTLQVTIEHGDTPADTVPVAWFDPPAAAAGLDVDDDVVVVGRVRRRFFRAGGTTQSRTEVVAETVVTAGRTAAVRKALAGAVERLAEGMDAAGSRRG